MSCNNRPNRWASGEDWDRHRETITRLYIDENSSLNDLIQIMKRDHGFFGTEKMYKTRLRRWGLRKYLTASDIPDILQAKPKDSGIGQRTALIIRGRPVDPRRINKYLKRTVGNGNSAAQTSSCENHPDYFRLQGVSSAASKSPSPRWIASPDSLQFPEQIIFFSQQFIDGTSHWARLDGRVTGSWFSAISAAQHLINDGHFRVAFAILDNCFEFLRGFLPNLDPFFLLRTYTSALSLPREIGERLVSFTAEIMTIKLPEKHPMTLAWQKLRRAGIYTAHEHAWHIMSSCITELIKSSGYADVFREFASWACVYYSGFTGLKDCDVIEIYQRKQLQSIEGCRNPGVLLHSNLNLAATCIANGKHIEAEQLIDTVSLQAIQKPEVQIQATENMMLHYHYSKFLVHLANGPQEKAIEAGKRLHRAFVESFDTWEHWGFVFAGWTRQHFSKIGMAEEADNMSRLLGLHRHQIPALAAWRK